MLAKQGVAVGKQYRRLMFRMTPDERQLLRDVAGQTNVNETVLVRKLLALGVAHDRATATDVSPGLAMTLTAALDELMDGIPRSHHDLCWLEPGLAKQVNALARRTRMDVSMLAHLALSFWRALQRIVR